MQEADPTGESKGGREVVQDREMTTVARGAHTPHLMGSRHRRALRPRSARIDTPGVVVCTGDARDLQMTQAV